MKDILVVIQFIRRGGVENAAINFALNLDSEKYNVSFLCVGVCESQDEEYKSELLNKGYSIFEIPQETKSLLGKYRFLNSFFKQNHFDVVHSHTIFFSAIVLLAAKIHNVPVRAAHSHIIKWNHEETLQYKTYKTVMRTILKLVANRKFACSQKAGEFLFGKREYNRHGVFVPNGIDVNAYSFSNEARKRIRNEYGISDKEVLFGHIGTIYRIKNQVFIVDVLAEYLKKYGNAKLILVGEEVDTEPVIKRVQELGVTERLIIAGQKSDVKGFYSAFDIMVFPSLHEALPLTLIEAQAAKLPCLLSDTITSEVKFNNNVEFCSLNSQPSVWAEKSNYLINKNRLNLEIKKLFDVYDINNVVSKLDGFYS